MRKKLTVLLSILLSLVFCFACGNSDDTKKPGDPDNDGPDNPPAVKEAKELLFDPHFENGISVTGLDSLTMSRTDWKYGDPLPSGDPFWTLGQYGNLSSTRPGYDASRNDLSLGTIFEDPKGITGKDGDYYTLTNFSGSKEIKINPAVGSVQLNADTRKEYCDQSTGDIVPRKNGEDWVHMILQPAQGIREVVQLDTAESFVMKLDFTLNYCDVYDTSIGADQFQWIFTVHDDSAGNPTLNDYFWFIVTLYDNRYEVFPGNQGADSGKADATGKFMYAPKGTDLYGSTGGKVQIGQKYTVELDLLDHMTKAYTAAKEKGFMPNAEWKNLTVQSFNIGWEVSNVSRASVTLENMSLKVKVK